MPHKHTRREKDPSTYDLPPSETAKPLPVTSISKKHAEPHGKKGGSDVAGAGLAKKSLKRKRAGAKTDDAPRAFKRLMAFAEGKRPRSGLDDGRGRAEPKKKGAKKKKENEENEGNAENGGKKNSEESATTTTTTTPTATKEEQGKKEKDNKSQKAPEIPTIRPGERLSEFAARVDAALPVAGLVNKTTVRDGKDPLGLKVRRTRKEKKMHRLYDEWRAEEVRIRERREEEREAAEERREEEDEALGLGVAWRVAFEGSGGGGDGSGGGGGGGGGGGVGGATGGKKKKGRKGGKKGDDDDDPWAEVKRRRGEARVGLNDVVQAPPELRAPENKLVGGAAGRALDVPKTAGSLRQREELQGIRDDVVASYRKLMSGKRAALPAI